MSQCLIPLYGNIEVNLQYTRTLQFMINQLVCEIKWLNLHFPLYHDTFSVMMFCILYSFVFCSFYTQTVVANLVPCLLLE